MCNWPSDKWVFITQHNGKVNRNTYCVWNTVLVVGRAGVYPCQGCRPGPGMPVGRWNLHSGGSLTCFCSHRPDRPTLSTILHHWFTYFIQLLHIVYYYTTTLLYILLYYYTSIHSIYPVPAFRKWPPPGFAGSFLTDSWAELRNPMHLREFMSQALGWVICQFCWSRARKEVLSVLTIFSGDMSNWLKARSIR